MRESLKILFLQFKKVKTDKGSLTSVIYLFDLESFWAKKKLIFLFYSLALLNFFLPKIFAQSALPLYV
jgi:hypothetical protein